jgi:acetyltransferase-like isoleucine patch superfamily enzyme
VTIGHDTYGEPRIIGEGKLARLELGSFCSISDEVVILLDAEHRPDWVTTYPFNVRWPECAAFTGHPHTKGNVLIGHDVWIGYGATILSGVTIGTGAVIGARALIARDVPPYAIVAGNPARVLRLRFAPATVHRLLKSKWWDLPRERLLSLMPLLLSNRIDEFLPQVEAKFATANQPH